VMAGDRGAGLHSAAGRLATPALGSGRNRVYPEKRRRV